MAVFDSKFFNSEVFAKYLETVPRVKQNALLNAGVLNVRGDLKSALSDQVGGNYVTVPMVGLIGGDADNYDGNTNIGDSTLPTYAQSMIVVGRAKGWREKDFNADITGKDFMGEIAAQVGAYWDEVDQATILSILKGIFAMTTGGNGFAADHTLDLSSKTGAEANVGVTSLNDAMQKAGGANKGIFTCVIMHSVVATNLENLNLISYAQGTDANGLRKDVALGTWNGRVVLIDDDVPVESGVYTTYVLGKGAFDYCDVGAKVPSETWRDPKTNGGEDVLYTRQRKLFAPRGISFKQPSSAIISPTAAQLEAGANWRVVTDAAGTGFFPSKAIPIARIQSKG